MTLFARQYLLAHACKCQVMLSTVWFPLTKLQRSRPKEGMNRGGKKEKSLRGSKCIYPVESAYSANVCKIGRI